ncbi:MAG: ATP-NAD kinase [Amphiamblys sp. WSBS2006]|nr:MAG: ATP-NAD kinase [Amphiamblys sp. WSBS2006]
MCFARGGVFLWKRVASLCVAAFILFSGAQGNKMEQRSSEGELCLSSKESSYDISVEEEATDSSVLSSDDEKSKASLGSYSSGGKSSSSTEYRSDSRCDIVSSSSRGTASTMASLKDVKKPTFIIVNKEYEYCKNIVFWLEEAVSFLQKDDMANAILFHGLETKIKGKPLCYWKGKNNSLVLEEENKPHQNIDTVITAGGDGTILTACYMFQNTRPKILSFNIDGTLGHLVSFHSCEFQTKIKEFIGGKLRGEEWMRLGVVYGNRGEKEFSRVVLNEVVIKGGIGKGVLTVDVYERGVFREKYAADGVIFSTPTGSTGYSKSAGGPILMQDTGCFVMAFICPISKGCSPVVYSGDTEIVLRPSASNRCKQFHMMFDQRETVDLEGGEIRIKKSPYSVFMMKN